MTETRQSGITAYLVQWGAGDPGAFAAVVPLVEHELRVALTFASWNLIEWLARLEAFRRAA